jgi:RNA polymerase sigma-70 factor (ECF subfamily)
MELCVDDMDAGVLELARRDGAEQLVERYGDRAYRLAWRITGVREDAEDVVVDALQAAADTFPAFTGDATLGPWISRAVASAAYQKLRAGRGRIREIAAGDVMPALDADGRHFAPMDDWSKRLDEPALQDDLGHIVSAALETLPASYRAALVLHDVEELPTLDIAEILGMDVPAVKSLVHRARLYVRKRLAEHFASIGGAPASNPAARPVLRTRMAGSWPY